MLQFDDALSHPDPKEELKKLVDQRLGEDYPIESIHKVKEEHPVHCPISKTPCFVFVRKLIPVQNSFVLFLSCRWHSSPRPAPKRIPS